MMRTRPVEWQTMGYIAVAVVVCALLVLRIWLDADRLRWLDPQPVLSFVGFIVGFLFLSWQLRRQHKYALAANQRQAQDRLKVELYDRFAERMEATIPPLSTVGVAAT